MTKRPISFEDLEKDTAGMASRAAFVALANELIEDGRQPRTVFSAMLYAAYEASLARSTLEYHEFAVSAAGHAASNKELAEALFEAELNSPRTQAFLKEIDFDKAIKEAEEALGD
ncbi:hypothetical protein [Cohaesibacter gelatinilyticus]|uniref:Uncharacterized protein n=1 Tax=Cohaesibacter gelatinilyticus TaxID=372072 RepID=A0A285PHW4_9HYPH|nr:hypothetical protein [Cohaesibacter gelatinilyticus]SNZ21330.1 hypothetical protein SAMN06265368_4447 [Cohaesibacter gelatinilyticus]